MSEANIDVPVLIAGAGPAGLTSALALSRYRIPYLLVEKHRSTAHTPRAHIVNQRTVEILRHLGVEDRLHAVATSQEHMRNNLWVTSLAGLEVARTEAWGTRADVVGDYANASPSPMVNAPQTNFEPMLVAAIRDAGGDLRFGTELLEAQQDTDGVTSTIRDRATGVITTVRSRYLIGADGARSAAMRSADLHVEGPSGLADVMNIWFRADLSRFLAHRPGVLTWGVAPGGPRDRGGVLICHKPFTEFVLGVPGNPQHVAPSEAELVAAVHRFVGAEDVGVEILGTAFWQVNAQVAPAYSAGRILCMGDAVHRHPPTNGLGLNLSVADAYNLAWKLALVLTGRAGLGLLDTYSEERQPVGAAGVARAIRSGGEMAAVEVALGYHPDQSVEEGQRELMRLYEPGAVGDARRAALQAALALSDYQFNAHGHQLGYRYTGGAVVDDGPPEPAGVGDPDLHYTPTTAPGARVPHARLGDGNRELSTLDLVDGAEFALLTGVGGEGWAAAAETASKVTGVPIRVHRIGGPDGLQDLYREWAARRQVGTDGCVLVRPDRHVAWRRTSFDATAATDLVRVLNKVLDRSGAPDVPAAAVRSTVGV